MQLQEERMALVTAHSPTYLSPLDLWHTEVPDHRLELDEDDRLLLTPTDGDKGNPAPAKMQLCYTTPPPPHKYEDYPHSPNVSLIY